MNRVIRTTYHGPGDRRVARIIASADGVGSTVVPYDHSADGRANHRAAASRMAVDRGWHGSWAGGALGSDSSYYWVGLAPGADGPDFRVEGRAVEPEPRGPALQEAYERARRVVGEHLRSAFDLHEHIMGVLDTMSDDELLAEAICVLEDDDELFRDPATWGLLGTDGLVGRLNASLNGEPRDAEDVYDGLFVHPYPPNPRRLVVQSLGVRLFNARWPNSALRDRSYWFEFDGDGKLVDTDAPEADDDGGAAKAMAEDCRALLLEGTIAGWML